MNKQRRKAIQQAIDQITDLRTSVEEINTDEQDSFDNLPESFQDSEKGETIQEAIDFLETATGAIDEVIDYLEQAQG
jgi:FtsZ-binding cell division protein ZapB